MGRHSVGVARQDCGTLGKQDNSQAAVSVTLACDQGSLPVAWRLYLAEEWAVNPERRRNAGVPHEVEFATKTSIQSRRCAANCATSRLSEWAGVRAAAFYRCGYFLEKAAPR